MGRRHPGRGRWHRPGPAGGTGPGAPVHSPRLVPLRPRYWSLRTRLVAVLLLLLAGSCAVVGTVTVAALHDFLLDRLDAQLTAAGDRSAIAVARVLEMPEVPEATSQPNQGYPPAHTSGSAPTDRSGSAASTGTGTGTGTGTEGYRWDWYQRYPWSYDQYYPTPTPRTGTPRVGPTRPRGRRSPGGRRPPPVPGGAGEPPPPRTP